MLLKDLLHDAIFICNAGHISKQDLEIIKVALKTNVINTDDKNRLINITKKLEKEKVIGKDLTHFLKQSGTKEGLKNKPISNKDLYKENKPADLPLIKPKTKDNQIKAPTKSVTRNNSFFIINLIALLLALFVFATSIFVMPEYIEEESELSNELTEALVALNNTKYVICITLIVSISFFIIFIGSALYFSYKNTVLDLTIGLSIIGFILSIMLLHYFNIENKIPFIISIAAFIGSFITVILNYFINTFASKITAPGLAFIGFLTTAIGLKLLGAQTIDFLIVFALAGISILVFGNNALYNN